MVKPHFNHLQKNDYNLTYIIVNVDVFFKAVRSNDNKGLLKMLKPWKPE